MCFQEKFYFDFFLSVIFVGEVEMSNNSLLGYLYGMKHGRCVDTISACKNFYLLTDFLKTTTINS